LESDDEDDKTQNPVNYNFKVNDIVWKLSYKTKENSHISVQDIDLINGSDIVAELFIIREILKMETNQLVSCIMVPHQLPLSSENNVTQKVLLRLLRPCQSYFENEKILQSQTDSKVFKRLKIQFENIQNYRFNHDDIEGIPEEDKKSPSEYLSMDKYQQSLYLTHLRTIKSRKSLDKNPLDITEDKAIEVVKLEDEDDQHIDILHEEVDQWT